ncbi:hypothetical protein J1N35_032596 [Gossypium stocksii]|uniref:Uncharacterized protein n=1 Tax=Gossypium stocksii TaxID=47602 RepID=A0A9D3V6H6_9ROSI|nr:hypothetical protein J1N35_032596 [Gossypium stocksii]
MFGVCNPGYSRVSHGQWSGGKQPCGRCFLGRCLQALVFSIEMGFWEHTNPKSNAVAHKVAQISFNFKSLQFWVENIPGEATDLVERDWRWMFDSGSFAMSY